MKAIPDLDFAAKQITKPAVPPKPQMSSLPAPGSTSSTPSLTPEHQPSKTPPKPPSKDGIPRRGSGEVTLSLRQETALWFWLYCFMIWLIIRQMNRFIDWFGCLIRGVDSATVSYREAVQVSTPSSSTTKFPIRPWVHNQQQWRSYHYKQECEGEPQFSKVKHFCKKPCIYWMLGDDVFKFFRHVKGMLLIICTKFCADTLKHLKNLIVCNKFQNGSQETFIQSWRN